MFTTHTTTETSATLSDKTNALSTNPSTTIASRATRPSPLAAQAQKPLSKSEALEAGGKELEWFYTDSATDPESTQARETIGALIGQLPSFHRGAFALEFSDRPWPESLRSDETKNESFAFVLRLACAEHPSDGTKSVDELERASIARLEAAVQEVGERPLLKLCGRASRHFDAAVLAYVKLRGRAPSLLPSDA